MSGENAHPRQSLAELLAHVPLSFIDYAEKASLLVPIVREALTLTGRSELSLGDPVLMSLITPQIVAKLKGFQHADQMHIAVWQPIFGKGAVTWRLLLAIEASYDKEAKEVLDWLLSRAAANFDAHESRLFTEAYETIKRSRHGYAKPDKANAVIFYLERAAMGQPVQDDKEIQEFLESCSPAEWKKKRHNLDRILTGPILGPLKRRKRGRPRRV